MIEVKGLPEYIKNEEVKDILFRHINKVLKDSVVYIGFFTDQAKKKHVIKPKDLKRFRKSLCSERVKTDKERNELILSLIRKIYSDKIEELTIEEKFILTKACDVAIDREENVIDTLAIEDDLRLENWMWDGYMIDDTDERRKVLKELEKAGINSKDYPVEILEEKPIMIRERILDVIGQPYMLIFEYPTVINMVFNPMEYQMLTGVQVEGGGNIFEKIN